MHRALILFGALALLSLPTIGCGGDACKSGCSDATSCEGNEDADVAACEKSCDDQRKMAQDAGCESEYDDVLSCFSGQDVCSPDLTACGSEVEAYGGCLGASA